MKSIKNSMSNLDIFAAIKEIQDKLKGSWLNNVYQINNIFLFKIRTITNENLTLLYELGKRIHLTNYSRQIPKTPTQFTMSLRKKIKRSRILEVSQYDLDRLVFFKLQKGDEFFTLILELFSNGNIILLDSEERILYAIKYKKMRDRDLLPKKQYTYPPKRGKDIEEINVEEIKALFKTSQKNIVQLLTSNLNIAGEYAEEVSILSTGTIKIQEIEVSEENIQNIISNLRLLVNKINKGELEPRIILDDEENMVSVIPLEFKKYSRMKFKRYPTFNEALDDYFSLLESKTITGDEEKTIDSKVKSLERIKENQINTINE
ncbi:MAG: NFACT family protein, partial [Candidatus Odinarchaeia archaeon]